MTGLAAAKRSVLGVSVSAVTYDEAVGGIIDAAEARRPLSVTALAVHGVMCGVLDGVHRFRLNAFDLVCPDGQPIRWALNLLHRAGLSDRVYGPELMLRVCRAAAAADLPVFLYGSRSAVLEKLTDQLARKAPGLRIAGAMPSLFRRSTPEEQARIVDGIRASGARIVFVGLGCPRQEVWTYENAGRLSLPTVAVGAAFDFHAGTLKQAPPRLQRHGLEWAYRLTREPRRLWRRYVLLNPAFLLLLAAQRAGLRRFEDGGRAPGEHENFA